MVFICQYVFSCLNILKHAGVYILKKRPGGGVGGSWYDYVGCVYTSCNMLHKDEGTSS